MVQLGIFSEGLPLLYQGQVERNVEDQVQVGQDILVWKGDLCFVDSWGCVTEQKRTLFIDRSQGHLYRLR